MLKKIRNAVLCFYLYYFVPIHYTDQALKPYKEEIVQVTQKYCGNKYYHPLHQYIYFKKLKPPTAAECVTKLNTYKILVDPTFWKYADDNYKWRIITHELGHCLLGLDHVDNPQNYMYYDDDVYLTKEIVRYQFIQDLRRRCGK